MKFWDTVGDPSGFPAHLPDYVPVYRVSLRRYRLLKLPLRCEVVEKRDLMANIFLMKRDIDNRASALESPKGLLQCPKIS